MHVGPNISARSDVLGNAKLPGDIQKPGHLHAIFVHAQSLAIDQAGAQDHRVYTTASSLNDFVVDAHPFYPARRGGEGCVCVIHAVAFLTRVRIADD